MKDCKNCEWAIHDPVWGEIKCEQHQRYIYNTDVVAENCDLYMNKIKPEDIKISKEFDNDENLF